MLSPVDRVRNLGKTTTTGSVHVLVADLVTMFFGTSSVVSMLAVVDTKLPPLDLMTLVSKDLLVLFHGPVGHMIQSNFRALVLRVVHLNKGLLLLIDGVSKLILLLCSIRLAMFGAVGGILLI